ncbi:MAG: glycosyltransferase [Desulfovermiculus sp.]
MHIVHISSVHHAQDPRIRHKQIQSILDHGWQATLITGDLWAGRDENLKAVTIPPGRDQRIKRIVLTAPRAIFQALKLKADIYHLHDPELLPWALVLRLKGAPVVYDIHEDYSAAVRQKHYLPNLLRPVFAQIAVQAEQLLASAFHKVIAEKYYARRFPQALPILNYPKLVSVDQDNAFTPNSRRLLYTGNVTEQRGALLMTRVIRARPDFTLVTCGYCPAGVARAMRSEAGPAAKVLQIIGQDRYVQYSEIMDCIRAGGWLAGLALFPDSDHYREKELTKFFEYMAVGLPIVASDFPAWRELIANQGIGLCVDAEDPTSVAKALDWLYNYPEQARDMGQRGQDLVFEKYNWEHEGQRLLDFYERIAYEALARGG